MQRSLPACAGLLVLVASASASTQGLQPLSADPVPLRIDAGGDMAPGVLWSSVADAPATTFANVTTAGFFATPPPGEEWVDWGVKAGGLTGVACTLEFGYGTSALDPSLGGPGAALELAVYQGTLGGCTPGDVAQQKRRFSYTGLPGSLDGSPAAYVIAVELATKTFALADGPIGWSYVGKDGVSGPLLIAVGADPTMDVDLFDLYVPAPAAAGVCTGSFPFGVPGVASFYLRLEEDDGSEPGSQTPRAGTGVNHGVLSPGAQPPKIGQSWHPSITTPALASPALDFLAVSSVALPPTALPGFGELLIGILSPNPLVVVSAPSPGGSPFNIDLPLNCALIGIPLSAQAGQITALGAIGMTDALDLTIGI